MRAGYHKVARDYVLYREERARERAENNQNEPPDSAPVIQVTSANGQLEPLDTQRLQTVVVDACKDLDDVGAQPIIDETLRNLYDGVPQTDVAQALTMSARTMIEKEANYTYVAARLLLDTMRSEALSHLSGETVVATQEEMSAGYSDYFKSYIKKAAQLELIDNKLADEYDLDALGAALLPERD